MTPMQPHDDFDRLMTGWMEVEGRLREPDGLLEATFERTRGARRRPRWLLTEWWLPERHAVWSRVLPRPVALILLLAALVVLAGMILVLAGAGHRRVPAPFGPAANGRLVVDTNGSLEVVDPAGAHTLPLISSIPSAAGATFSRDGTRLVFWGDGSPDSLYLALADGTGVRKLAGDLWISTDKSPAWSPDGRSVAISTESGADRHDESLLVIDVDAGQTARLDTSQLAGVRALYPSWSPDGQWIAFVGVWVGLPPASSIASYWVIHPDGTGAHELPTSDLTQDVIAAHWAPDATRLRLAYTAVGAGGTPAVFVLDVPTGDEVQVSNEAAGRWPAWSPDGTRLAWLAGSTLGDIRVAMADGSADAVTIAGTGIEGPPAWSPDGRQIYALDARMTHVIVVTVDGSAPIARIPHTASQALPDWQRISP